MTDTFVPNAENQRLFRSALGQFATGVAVVATRTKDQPIGMTINSFSSVSLDPPLMLWSLGKESDRYDVFSAAEQFTVQMLREDQRNLANRFAERGDAFDGDWVDGALRTPILPTALAVLECKRVARHDAGDHLIIIGQVVRAHMRDGAPLVFAKGSFGQFSTGS